MVFDGPYETTASSINGKPVNNSLWSYDDSDPDYHIFTSTSVISAAGFSKFGFKSIWDAGATMGTYPLTSQITSGSGGEIRMSNDVDAEQVDYFID